MRFWDLESKGLSDAVKNFDSMHTEQLQYCSLIHLEKFSSYESSRILNLPSLPCKQTLNQANYYITYYLSTNQKVRHPARSTCYIP